MTEMINTKWRNSSLDIGMSTLCVSEIYTEAIWSSKYPTLGVNSNTLLVSDLPVQTSSCMANWAGDMLPPVCFKLLQIALLMSS